MNPQTITTSQGNHQNVELLIFSLHIGFVEPVYNLFRDYYTHKILFSNDHLPKEWKSENNSRKPANLHTSPSLRWWTFEIFFFYLYNFFNDSPWEKLNSWDTFLTCITSGQCTLLSFHVYGDSVQQLVTIFSYWYFVYAFVVESHV